MAEGCVAAIADVRRELVISETSDRGNSDLAYRFRRAPPNGELTFPYRL
jgi:hypothetical protein